MFEKTAGGCCVKKYRTTRMIVRLGSSTHKIFKNKNQRVYQLSPKKGSEGCNC